jgi:Peptidase M50B-like
VKSSLFAGSKSPSFSFWSIVIGSVLLAHVRGFSWLFAPVNVFTTLVHEMGHASVCLATGGQVGGLTIVADGAGHGGLTLCSGGNPFLYTQAGYLGAALFGCVLVILGQYRRLSKPILIGIGLAAGFATLFLVSGSIFKTGMLLQGLMSLGWAGFLSVALIWAGIKAKPNTAHLLVLFLAAQTALNSITSIGDLLSLSLGLSNIAAFSDATNMAAMTGIPAWFWSIFWAGCSIAMFAFTLKITHLRQPHKRS